MLIFIHIFHVYVCVCVQGGRIGSKNEPQVHNPHSRSFPICSFFLLFFRSFSLSLSRRAQILQDFSTILQDPFARIWTFFDCDSLSLSLVKMALVPPIYGDCTIQLIFFRPPFRILKEFRQFSLIIDLRVYFSTHWIKVSCFLRYFLLPLQGMLYLLFPPSSLISMHFFAHIEGR